MKEMRKLSFVWGLMLVIVFGVLTFFALKWKNENEPYFKLEESLVSATKYYYESAYSYPNKGEQVRIKYKELKDNNMIESLSINDSECDGYVIVKNNGVIEYNGYIKCENYTTKNYSE